MGLVEAWIQSIRASGLVTSRANCHSTVVARVIAARAPMAGRGDGVEAMECNMSLLFVSSNTELAQTTEGRLNQRSQTLRPHQLCVESEQ